MAAPVNENRKVFLYSCFQSTEKKERLDKKVRSLGGVSKLMDDMYVPEVSLSSFFSDFLNISPCKNCRFTHYPDMKLDISVIISFYLIKRKIKIAGRCVIILL